MTDQDIIDAVADSIGISVINSRILGWCNSFISFLSKEYRFPHLDVKAATLAITANNNTYPLSSVAYLKNVWIPERKLYPAEMVYNSEEELTELWPTWNTDTGPVYLYFWAGNSLILIKKPISNDTAYYSYQKYATPMVAGKTTEYTGFDADVHLLIQYYAEMQGYNRHKDLERYDRAMQSYMGMKQSLKLKVHRRPDLRGYVQGTGFPTSRTVPLAYIDRSRLIG